MKKIKSFIKDFGSKTKRIVYGVVGTISTLILGGENVFATDVTGSLNNLKTLFMGAIGIIGVIVLAKNIMDFANALQERDSQSMKTAGLGMAGGAMMAGVGSVLAILGF